VEKDFTAVDDKSGTVDISIIRGAIGQPLISAIVLVPAA
jgi:hypothetical protein